MLEDRMARAMALEVPCDWHLSAEDERMRRFGVTHSRTGAIGRVTPIFPPV